MWKIIEINNKQLEPSQEKHAKANFNAKNGKEPRRASARFVKSNGPCKEYWCHTDEDASAPD